MSNFGITITNMPKVTNEVGQILGVKIEKLQGSQILAALEKAAAKIAEQQREIDRLSRFEQEWNGIEERGEFRSTFLDGLDETKPDQGSTAPTEQGTDDKNNGTPAQNGGTVPLKWVLVGFFVLVFFFVLLFHNSLNNNDVAVTTPPPKRTDTIVTDKGTEFENKAKELEIRLLKINSNIDK